MRRRGRVLARCKLGIEGVVSKRKDLPTAPAARRIKSSKNPTLRGCDARRRRTGGPIGDELRDVADSYYKFPEKAFRLGWLVLRQCDCPGQGFELAEAAHGRTRPCARTMPEPLRATASSSATSAAAIVVAAQSSEAAIMTAETTAGSRAHGYRPSRRARRAAARGWRSSADGDDEQIFGADKQDRSRDQSD